MSKIKTLKIRDFKRISSLDIDDADKAIIILGGKNGAGKSSALDAIATALGGGKLIPSEPIRKGADKGEVSVTTDDGITIRRTYAKREDGTVSSSLTIRTADGMSPRGAQGWLDARLGNLAVDPVAFMSLTPDKQAQRLREIAGIDTRPLDVKRRAIYDERRDIGRDGTTEKGRLDALPHYDDAPTEPVVPSLTSSADVLAELERARESERAVERAESVALATERVVDDYRRDIRKTRDTIADLEARIKDERKALAALEKDGEAKHEHHQALVRAAEQARAAVIGPAPSKARLDTLEDDNAKARAIADEQNRRIEANQRRAEQEARVKTLRADYAAKTAALDAIDAEKAAMLAAAKFPVDGLGFGEDGTVTYQGLPLDQASGAQKLRVSMALALAGDPEIRVVLIRDASLLDDDSLALVQQMAEDRGAQVWLERVGTRDPGAIVIEDGGVA